MQTKVVEQRNHQQISEQQYQSFSQNSEKQYCESVSNSLMYQQIKFPAFAKKLPQLYKLYKQNNDLKQSLQVRIQQLKKLKKTKQFLERYEQMDQLEQVYDMDQIAQIYQESKSQFQSRNTILNNLRTQYKKINYEETLMLQKQLIKNVTEQYIHQNRHILQIKCYPKFIIMLTEEKKIKKGRKKLEKIQKQSFIEIANIPRNKSQSSQLSDKHKNHSNYVYEENFMIRFIHYQQIFPQLVNKKALFRIAPHILPSNMCSKPTGISFNSYNQTILIKFQNNSIEYFEFINQNNRNKVQVKHFCQDNIKIDMVRIVWIQNCHQKLYVATEDGVLRIYITQLNQNKSFKKYQLNQIVGCFVLNQSIHKVTHYSFIQNNSDEIFFIGDKRKICKMNLKTLKGSLIHTLNQDIIKINSTYIQTLKLQMYQPKQIFQGLCQDILITPDLQKKVWNIYMNYVINPNQIGLVGRSAYKICPDRFLDQNIQQIQQKCKLKPQNKLLIQQLTKLKQQKQSYQEQIDLNNLVDIVYLDVNQQKKIISIINKGNGLIVGYTLD